MGQAVQEHAMNNGYTQAGVIEKNVYFPEELPGLKFLPDILQLLRKRVSIVWMAMYFR